MPQIPTNTNPRPSPVIKTFGTACLFALFLFFVGGCNDAPPPAQTPVASEDRDQLPPPAQPRLILYNWEDYISESVLWQFEEATGITVELRVYADDEDILGAAQSGSFDGDLAILSESVAAEMIKARLLHDLDLDALPNAKHISPEYMWPDPETGRHFKIPYLMGITCLMVNTKHVPGPYNSWRILWEESLRGRVAMLNNPFEVIAVPSLILGHGVNPSGEQLEAIARLLTVQKPLLAGYLSYTEITDLMIRNELWAAQLYSGDGLMAMEQNGDLAFIIPEEGCVAWVDVFVIPLSSANPQDALRFINFIHQPEVMGRLASELWSATPNTPARAFIAPEVLNSPMVNPPQEILARCEYFGDMGGDEAVRQRLQLWSRLVADE